MAGCLPGQVHNVDEYQPEWVIDTGTEGGTTDMASIGPPDGWEVESGTWGTDIDREDTIVLTGAHSLKLASGSAPVIYSPWIPINNPSSVGAVDTPNTDTPSVTAYCRYYADRISAGDNIDIDLIYYDIDRASAGTVHLVATTPAATADAWYTAGENRSTAGSQVHWARFKFTKANTAFNLYIDSVVAERGTSSGEIELSGTQSITAAGGWQRVNLSTGVGLYETDYDTTNDLIEYNVPGKYHIYGMVNYTGLASGEQAKLRLVSQTGSAISPFTVFATQASATGKSVTLQISMIKSGRPSLGVGLETDHDSGSDRTINGGYLYAYRIGR